MALQNFRLGQSPLERAAPLAFRLLLGVWLILLTVVVARFFTAVWPGKNWPHGLLLLLTCGVALANVWRHLPLQNMLGVACLVGGMGGLAHSMTAATGVPFGPCVYTRDIGRLIFDFLPWPMPFLWVSFLLASRGTARLMLRPWRLHRAYGFILIGLSTALAVVLDLGLEVFASKTFPYWEWGPTKVPVDWHGVPVVNFLGWVVVGLLILCFATPFLLNKQPGPIPPPDWVPLLLWSGTSLLFAVGAYKAEAKGAALVLVSCSAAVVAMALWGMRTRR